MTPVIVLCFEEHPTGQMFLPFGTRKGETVAFVRMDESGDIVCVNPECLRCIDVIAVITS